MGHSPQMTLSTYAHVIQELKGAERVSIEEQIRRGRRSRGPSVGPQGLSDVDQQTREAAETALERDSSGWIRTSDLTIMSGAL
jgi:hypothetical protein